MQGRNFWRASARGWVCGFGVAIVALAGGAPAAADSALAQPDRSGWKRALDRALSSDGLRGAKVSALVVRQSDGAVLYERTPDRMMIPASNAKVLTALAALDAFGPAHQFETQVLAKAPLDREGRAVEIHLVGGGDPAITNEDWWRMAAELRDAGLTAVDGDVVVDDGLFDTVRWHPTVQGVSSRAYHAPVGALNANYGSFAVTVTPGVAAGHPVRVTVNPPLSYLKLSNQSKTLAAGKRRTLVVDRAEGEGRERVSIRGGLRLGDEPKTYYRSVLHPDLYAGHVLRMQLEAVGIAVAGNVRRGRAPESAVEIHRFAGRSLGEIVRLFMKFSNNGIAEALVKNLGVLASGGVGTWQDGMPELRRRLVAQGVPAEAFSLVDGSGLSYEDRVAPRALVAALRAGVDSFRFAPEFMASLPIAARDGTLEERAVGAQDRVRAKTGLLNRVTGLSGYAAIREEPDAKRELVVFSVLANQTRHGDKAAMDALDQFAALLTQTRPR